MTAPSMPAELVRCRHCGRRNRVPAAAPGIPRCGYCHQPLPWIADVGGSGAHRQDEHRADGHLEDLLAQVQRVSDGQPERDRDAQAPPGEPDRRGQPERQQDARHHAGHPAHRAAHRLVDADLGDQQRRQRRQHRTRRAGYQQRHQVGEDGRDRQPDDRLGRRLGPLPDQGHPLRDDPRAGARHAGIVPEPTVTRIPRPASHQRVSRPRSSRGMSRRATNGVKLRVRLIGVGRFAHGLPRLQCRTQCTAERRDRGGQPG
jgi:hypothetical protein